jgi:acetyl-CoA C-acetyltransferase
VGTAVIAGAVRTPIGKRGGVLSGLHAAEILGCAQTALLDRAGIDPGRVAPAGTGGRAAHGRHVLADLRRGGRRAAA